MFRKCIAEFIGTAILVTFGCSAAAWGVAPPVVDGIGTVASYVGIALVFGLVIVALAYSIGNISGCHVNPAVSFAMLINGKMKAAEFCAYAVAQCLGAVFGGLMILFMYAKNDGDLAISGFGTNGYGDCSAAGISLSSALITEIILTFLFVFAILGVTSKKSFEAVSGVVIGLTLTLVHLVGLPLTGTSVNPARSLGAAVTAALAKNYVPIQQVWVFIVAPMFGAALAALVWKVLSAEEVKVTERAPAARTDVGKVVEIRRNNQNPAPKASTSAKTSGSKNSKKKRR